MDARIEPFVGPVCRSRFGRTSRRCALPVLHDGDHEDEQGSWHPRPPQRLGMIEERGDA